MRTNEESTPNGSSARAIQRTLVIQVGFFVAVALTSIIVLWSYSSVKSLADTNLRSSHAHEEVMELETTMDLIRRMERDLAQGQKPGNDHRVEEYGAQVRLLAAEIGELKRHAPQDDDYQTTVVLMGKRADSKVALSEDLIRRGDNRTGNPLKEAMALTDEIGTLINHIQQYETREFARRTGAAQSRTTRAIMMHGAGSLLSIALLVAVFILLTRDISWRRREEDLLRRLNEDLEERVRQRMIELEKTNAVLIAEAAERQAAEQSLRASEERFRALTSMAPVGVYLTDTDGGCLYANDRWLQVAGISLEEALGDGWVHALHPEDREYVMSAWRRMVDSRGEWSAEYRFRTPGGRVTVVQGVATPLLDSDGRNVGYIGANTDITERKLAEQTLLQRKNALKAVYEMATTLRSSFEELCDQVVLRVSELLEVPYVSVHSYEKNGLRVMSRSIDRVLSLHPIIPAAEELCEVAFEQGQVCRVGEGLQGRFPKDDFIRTKGFRSCTAIPVKNNQGTVVGILCLMDYRERMYNDFETNLLEIFASYVAHEHERAAAESQMRDAERLKVVGQLVSGVAHEVRNPLNAILAITEALYQDLKADDEHRPYLDHIKTQVDRLSLLMKDLLDLGKPTQQYRFGPEDLYRIVSVSADLWRQLPLSREHPVVVSVAGEVAGGWTISADGARLQQVLLNLIENAAQHSPPDSEIALSLVPLRSGFVGLRVADRGTGIPEGNLSKIFDPFFTTRRGGTGLGLSIVRHIIEVHGGSVRVWNNSPDSGCTFEIALMAHTEEL